MSRGLGLLLARVDADVEYVAPAQYDVSVVGCRRVSTILCRALQYGVHVTIRLDHLPAVFYIILQPNVDFGI